MWWSDGTAGFSPNQSLNTNEPYMTLFDESRWLEDGIDPPFSETGIANGKEKIIVYISSNFPSQNLSILLSTNYKVVKIKK